MSWRRVLLVLSLLVGLGVAHFFWSGPSRDEKQMEDAETKKFATLSDPAQTVHYPVSGPTDPPANSPSGIPEDFTGALSELFGNDLFDSVFVTDDLMRKFVLSVENATEHSQPSSDLSPFKPIKSEFQAEQDGDRVVISPENYQRYKPMVDLLRSVDTDRLIAVYVHFYPRLQAIYQSIGSKRYFNDRLIEAIDNLLAAPKLKSPIALIRPGSQYKYKFTDERLENLSFAQKISLRIGPANAKIVRVKLRKIRNSLIHLGSRS